MNPEDISPSSSIGGSHQKYFTEFPLLTSNSFTKPVPDFKYNMQLKDEKSPCWTWVTAFTPVKLMSSISTRILGSMWRKWHFPWRALTQTNPRKFGWWPPSSESWETCSSLSAFHWHWWEGCVLGGTRLRHGGHFYWIILFLDNGSGLTVTIPSVEMLTLNIFYLTCFILVTCYFNKIQLLGEKK